MLVSILAVKILYDQSPVSLEKCCIVERTIMGTPYSAIITLIVTAGVLNVLMGIYVLVNRSKQSMVKTFLALSICASFYTFGSAMELSAHSLEEIVFWIKIQYIGMPFLPPIGLMLIMHFLGMDRYLRRPLRLGLFIVPIITLALVMTNEAHHLYYRNIGLRADSDILKVNLDIGPWYIIQGAFTFGFMVGGLLLLLLHWKRMKTSYRKQYFTMLIGLLLPLAGDFVYLGGLTPDGMDPIPVIMTLTSAFYMIALASRGLLNVVPIARDTLFESMEDGVLVFDMDNKLVDYNPTAALIFPNLTVSSIGKPIDELRQFQAEPSFLSFFNEDKTEEANAHLTIHETLWTVDGQSRSYQIRLSTVRKKGGQEIGKLVTVIDITDRVKLEGRLRELAFHDGLTGIVNRIHFLHQSKALLTQSSAKGESLALVMFDVDHFKRVNDAYGHDVGDQALIFVVDACRRVLRQEDVFARYGGEEFVIAMPGLALFEAEAAAHRIRQEIAGQPMSSSKGPIALTASFGVAATDGSGCKDADGSRINELLKAADYALYEAKSSGRNTVRLSIEIASL